jgi:hypothetical protein
MLDAHGPRRLCCEGLHVSAGGLTTDLIHFTTSLLITAVLLVLTLRAARLPGTPAANILFAVCGILWSAGGLAGVLMLAAGMARDARDVRAAWAVQYSGAAIFPIAILAVWRPFAALPWQKTAARALQICAGISAAAIGAVLVDVTVFAGDADTGDGVSTPESCWCWGRR